MDKLKSLLIEDLNKAHKFLVVQLAAILWAVSELYEYLPESQKYLPEHWQKYAFIAIILARVIRQSKP